MVTAGSLRAFLHTFSNPKLKICQSWLLQILDGLEFLHARGLVHGSLSCGHIYINTNIGELKIGDLAVVQLSNVIQDTWKSPADDIRNLGIIMLEVALTQLFGKHRRIKQAVARLYDSAAGGETEKLQSQLLSCVADREYAELIRACLGAFEKYVTPAELRHYAFFQHDLEGYLCEVLSRSYVKAQGPKRSKPATTKEGQSAVSAKRAHSMSGEFVEDLLCPIQVNILISTLSDRTKASNKVKVKIFQSFRNAEKSIEFMFDLTKDTVFGVTAEMKAQSLFPPQYLPLIMQQLHSAIVPKDEHESRSANVRTVQGCARKEERKRRLGKRFRGEDFGEYFRRATGDSDDTSSDLRSQGSTVHSKLPEVGTVEKRRATSTRYCNLNKQQVLTSMGNISPIEKVSVVSTGTVGTFLEHMKPVIMSPDSTGKALRIDIKTSPMQKSGSSQADLTLSDAQWVTPRNCAEDDVTPRISPGTILGRKEGVYEEVRMLQRALNEVLTGEQLRESGEFTQETEQAVMQYQALKKIAQTGEVNEEQWNMIMQDVRCRQKKLDI